MKGLDEMLVQMHTSGSLSAKQLCVLGYWVKHCGVTDGLMAKFAMRPDSANTKKHYNRKVRGVLGLDALDKGLMRIVVPGNDRHNVGRVTHSLAVRVPHEALHAEVLADPELHSKHVAAVANGGYTSLYMDHPVAKASNHAALPLTMYFDGVPFTKTILF